MTALSTRVTASRTENCWMDSWPRGTMRPFRVPSLFGFAASADIVVDAQPPSVAAPARPALAPRNLRRLMGVLVIFDSLPAREGEAACGAGRSLHGPQPRAEA